MIVFGSYLVLAAMLAGFVLLVPVMRSGTFGLSRRAALVGWLVCLFLIGVGIGVQQGASSGVVFFLLTGSMIFGSILLVPMIRPGSLGLSRRQATLGWLACWFAFFLGALISPMGSVGVGVQGPTLSDPEAVESEDSTEPRAKPQPGPER